MRWSLKTTFLIITVIALFLASKYNERNREVLAAKQIQHLGGEVSYQWQQPSVGLEPPSIVMPAPGPATYTITLPDGTTDTRTRYTVERSSTWNATPLNTICHGSTQPPTRSLLDAIWPNNNDVFVAAVQINEEDVNEAFLAPLRDLTELKILQICRQREYFVILAAGNAPKEQREKDLKELGVPFELAKAMIQAELPDVNIIDGIVRFEQANASER